jgi:hypothetical protein
VIVGLPNLPAYSQSTFLGRHHITNPTNFGRHCLAANIDRWLPSQRNKGAVRAYKSVHNAKLHLCKHSFKRQFAGTGDWHIAYTFIGVRKHKLLAPGWHVSVKLSEAF